MKTPPVQQKQAAEPQQESVGLESEGKSMAPPAFQLKASGAGGGGGTPPVQRAAQLLTINVGDAVLRDGPPGFADLGKMIPRGTRVEILEEKVVNKVSYIRVKDHDSDKELGWTKKSNAVDLGAKYANAKTTYVYHVAGFDLMVYVPKDGLKKTNPDVFMFFHGIGGNYKTTNTHAKNGGYDDNPALAADIPGAVSNTGNIAICPQGPAGSNLASEWSKIGAGKFKSMVDMTLAYLAKDLEMGDKPLTAGNISIAGHSAGGGALGQAALDTGATDVTLQEAGYNFAKSWEKLQQWFLTGDKPRTIRVITQNNGNKYATSKPVDGEGAFTTGKIVEASKTILGEANAVKVEKITPDGKEEPGGIIMERGYRVLRKDGSLVGSLRVYRMVDTKADHWAVATKTMEASMTSGAKDRAADEKAMKK